MLSELIKQQYAQMRGVEEVVKDTSKLGVWVTKETLTAKKAIEFIGYKFQSNCENNVKIKPRKLKQCNKCGLYKCVDEFTRNAKNKDGLSYNCRACIKKYRIEHSFYKKCSKCAKRKPLDEFANNSSSVDGKSGYCLKCNKTYLREYHESRKKTTNDTANI